MKEKKERNPEVIMAVIFVIIWGVINYFFGGFNFDDNPDNDIMNSNTIANVVGIAISYAITPCMFIWALGYILKIKKQDFTKGDKSLSVWIKLLIGLLLLVVYRKTNYESASTMFIFFCLLAISKVAKKNTAYAKIFLVYAFIFNPLIKISFLLSPTYVFMFIGFTLVCWSIVDVTYYRINKKNSHYED